MNLHNREYERNNVFIYLRLLNCADDSVFGYLLDISDGGLKLMSNEPKTFGEAVCLRIDLSDSELLSHRSVYLHVVCSWSRKSEEGKGYDSGFHFNEEFPVDNSFIASIIDSYTYLTEYNPNT